MSIKITSPKRLSRSFARLPPMLLRCSSSWYQLPLLLVTMKPLLESSKARKKPSSGQEETNAVHDIILRNSVVSVVRVFGADVGVI